MNLQLDDLNDFQDALYDAYTELERGLYWARVEWMESPEFPRAHRGFVLAYFDRPNPVTHHRNTVEDVGLAWPFGWSPCPLL